MRAIALSIAASAALIGSYLALGGASYTPAKAADPCAERPTWRDTSGFQDVAQQIVLSALDGAACELGVSREEVVLAFASRDRLERFRRRHRIGAAKLGRLVHSGLIRTVDDAEHAGALSPRTADLLRTVVRGIRLEGLLGVLDFLPGA